VEVVQQAWLKRAYKVETDEGSFLIEYNGRGIGYETVRVNGEVVSRPRSWFWFVPHFDFFVGSMVAAIDVKIGITLSIKAITLSIDSKEVFHERAQPS